MSTVLQLGNGLELWKISPSEIREQDVNARSMTPKMFERLQKTIERDGRLESLPFCATTARGLEVVSGHHRIRAATAAQLPEIYAIVDVSGLNQSQIAAKQLAHNSIQGEDDGQLVAEIYRQIEDADSRLESFIVADELPKIEVDTIEVPVEFKTVVLTFVPTAVERVHEAIEAIKELPSADEAWIAAMNDRQKLETSIAAICKDYDIRVVSDAIGKMAELALEACGKEPVEREAVHLKDLFGTAWVPKDVADEAKKLIKKMIDRGIVKSKQDAIVALVAGFNLPSE